MHCFISDNEILQHMKKTKMLETDNQSVIDTISLNMSELKDVISGEPLTFDE